MVDLLRGVKNWLSNEISSAVEMYISQINTQRDYRIGKHRPQLKVKFGSYDDNITVNYVGLVINRAVTMLFGKGVEFTVPDDAAAEYLAQVWNANKQEILLHKAGMFGAEDGTCYVKILPDALTTRDGAIVPRLVVLDPARVVMRTNPEDYEQVIRYVISYDGVDASGERVRKKQVIEYEDGAVSDAGYAASGTWVIVNYEQNKAGNWIETSRQDWGYDFPPIIHWQNLPAINSVYGMPDVTSDIIDLQDKINFLASNINKIIRFHAHPKTIGKGMGAEDLKTGPDGAIFIPIDADVFNLEMQSDLASSQAFLLSLRQSLFDITQTVDLSSVTDKIGALTNFGLRVLYQDALAKLGTKRELYGDALIELNDRLLILAGMKPVECTVIWKDALPENKTEDATSLQFDLANGLVSKKTATQMRGYDYDAEQENISGEQTQTGNIGAAILAAFERNNAG